MFLIKLQNAIIGTAHGEKNTFSIEYVCSLASGMSDSLQLMDLCPPDSSIHGILQARILEWVAMSSSSGIFLTQGSNPHLFCLLH